jgi:FkbM family methyltransferase
VTTVSRKQTYRNSLRRLCKFVLERALPWAEWLTGFHTAEGDYLPNRLRILLGNYEAEESRLMRLFLQPGQTIVDVGANVGYLTRRFARSTGPAGKVYAFEPNPIIFPLLTRNVGQLSHVRAWNCGLSSETGEAFLFLAGSDHSVGSFSAKYPATHVFYQETGELHSLRAKLVQGDEFLAEHGVRKIDIAKIDVEGWELKVLRGLEKTIAASPSLAIFCEYNRAAQESAGHGWAELPNWFFERGFTLALPKNGALRKISQEAVGELIEQLPRSGFTTLFASRAL